MTKESQALVSSLNNQRAHVLEMLDGLAVRELINRRTWLVLTG